MGKNRYPKSRKWYYLIAVVIIISFFFPYMVAGKAPKIFILDPDEGDVVNGPDPVEIKVSAYDNTGVVKVECFIDGNQILGKQNADPEYEALWSCVWDTQKKNAEGSSVYPDGLYVIEAKATDTSGKTADDSISVRVKNESGNSPPIADISYSSEGYTYYFYPYECHDPDGFITKYQYAISKLMEDGSFSDPDIYACYDGECDSTCYDDEHPADCEPECYSNPPSSPFCLFFVCPYICYDFASPGNYRVTLKVWDDYGLTGVVDSDLPPGEHSTYEIIEVKDSGSNEDMYVRSIVSKRKIMKSGTTYYLYVTVLSDSNANGMHDPDDMPVRNVLVRMEIYKDIDADPDGDFDEKDEEFIIKLEKTTDRNGVALFVIRGMQRGDYQAKVVDLIDQDPERSLEYNLNLDGMSNPTDITVWQ